MTLSLQHLLNIFINDLVENIEKLNFGIKNGDINLSILLYADNIAVIAANKKDLQTMLSKSTGRAKTSAKGAHILKISSKSIHNFLSYASLRIAFHGSRRSR